MSAHEWYVRVHNDEVTSALVVIDVLPRLCGLPWSEAIEVTRAVHRGKRSEVAACPGRAEAEELAVALQRYGLRTTVWCR